MPPKTLSLKRGQSTEQIISIPLTELYSFPDHPYGIREDQAKRNAFDMDFLSSAIEQTERGLEEAKLVAEAAQQQLADIEMLAQQRKDELNEIITWADVYGGANLERKKMIVSQLIKKVSIGRGYQVSVEFNITFDELQRAISGEYREETDICAVDLPVTELQTSA